MPKILLFTLAPTFSLEPIRVDRAHLGNFFAALHGEWNGSKDFEKSRLQVGGDPWWLVASTFKMAAKKSKGHQYMAYNRCTSFC